MKYTLITGPTSGIGFDFAKIFAKKGHNLVLVGRNRNKLDAVKKTIGEINKDIKIYDFLADLSGKDVAQRIFDFTQKNNLFIDILVNNAGFGEIGKFYQGDFNKQMDMIQVNAATPTALTYLFLKKMVEKNQGKILNVSSIAAFFPGPSMSVYFATKSFVLSFSEAIGEEVKDKNITVTTLCPGATKTEFFKQADTKNMNSKTKMASSKDVAMFGYENMMTGKKVAIYGWENRLLVNIIKYLPRSIVLKIFGMMF